MSEDPRIQKGLATIAKPKAALSDLWSSVLDTTKERTPFKGSRKAPVVTAMTEEQAAALQRLPEVYASVVPLKDRVLTHKELVQIIEEREVIDLILGLIEKRKSDSLRETLANHLDHVWVTPEDEEDPDVDAKGHYRVKQEVPVDGTGKKIQKTVSSPKPSLSAAAVEQAHKSGLLDRKTYLAITKMPEVSRVLDEAGLVKAIKADPGLMLVLAPLTQTADPTITIKVVDDK